MDNYTGIDYRSIQLSYAAACISEYDNSIIKPNEIVITINSNNSYVKKENGFFIFTDQYKGIIRIYAKGTGWQANEAYIDTDKESERIIYMRLLPDRLNRSSGKMTVIKGSGMPGQVLYLLLECKKNPYIVSSDYKADNTIMIFHEEDNFLTAMAFMADNEEGSVFTIGENESLSEKSVSFNRRYMINENRRLSGIQRNSHLKRLFIVNADSRGDFYFLVPKEAEEDKVYEYFIKDELKGQEQEKDLTQFHYKYTDRLNIYKDNFTKSNLIKNQNNVIRISKDRG